LGISGVIEAIKKRVAGAKVYISVDIDVLDPAFAPGEHSYALEEALSNDVLTNISHGNS
jgi:hypothetical protein